MTFAYSLFDALLEPCFVLNKDLKVVYCNETAAILCNLTIRKVQRSNFRDLFSFSEPVEWLNAIENVVEWTPYKEVKFSTPEGGAGKVQITCQEGPPIADGERTWIVFVRDVTLEERLQNKYRGELEQKEGYIVELQKAQSELEKYSKNLEKMVEERTIEIRQLNHLMGALLDSLSQGFFAFDKDGRCHDFSSKACETVLEGRPNGKAVWDVLKVPPHKVDGVKKWMRTLFADMLPFADLAVLGPPTYPHSEGHHIKLEYFPLASEAGTEGIVVVASDITALIEAQRDAETERENARLILNLVNKRQQISRFVRETQIVLKDLRSLLAADPASWNTEEIFRCLHTTKGGCASFSVHRAANATHEAENRLALYRDDPTPDKATRLREQSQLVVQEFDHFLEETKKILGPAAFSENRHVEVSVEDLKRICGELGRSSGPAQELAAALRSTYLLERAGSFFEPYDEVIRTVAEQEFKQVRPLMIEGGDLPILPEAYSTLFSTFVHAFRNAVDHGIETPETRVQRGKPEAGTISVALKKTGGHLTITMTDDGNGIDPRRIRAKLASKGVDTAGESDAQVIQHVFDSSFSTRDIVTETSGRGVGMDAIKVSAEDLGGTCVVSSKPGEGTVLTVSVPWFEDAPEKTSKRAA